MAKTYFFTIFFILLNGNLASVGADTDASVGADTNAPVDATSLASVDADTEASVDATSVAPVDRVSYLGSDKFISYSSSQNVISHILSAYLYEVYLIKKKQIHSQYSDIKTLVDLNKKQKKIKERSDSILKMEQQGIQYIDETKKLVEQATAYDKKRQKIHLHLENLHQEIEEQKKEIVKLSKEIIAYELETNALIKDHNQSLNIKCKTTECKNERAHKQQQIKDRQQLVDKKITQQLNSLIEDQNQKQEHYNAVLQNYNKVMQKEFLELNTNVAELENTKQELKVKEQNILSVDSPPASADSTPSSLLKIKEIMLNAEYEWINSFLFSAYPQREGEPTQQEQQKKFQSLREKFLSTVSEDIKNLAPSFIETYELVSAIRDQLKQQRATVFSSKPKLNSTSILSDVVSMEAFWDYRLPVEGEKKKCLILQWMRTGEISRFLSEKEPFLTAVSSEYFSDLSLSKNNHSETPGVLLVGNIDFCPPPETFMEALFFNSFYHLVSFYKVKKQRSIYYEIHVKFLSSVSESKKSPSLPPEATSNPSRFFVIGPKGGLKKRDLY